MSDKTPNPGFDELDTGEDFRFPGAEPEGLTEEERVFAFDEDYLGDRPASASKEREAAVLAALQRQSRSRAAPEPKPAEEPEAAPASDRVDALAEAFRKLARRSAEDAGTEREPEASQEPAAEPAPEPKPEPEPAPAPPPRPASPPKPAPRKPAAPQPAAERRPVPQRRAGGASAVRQDAQKPAVKKKAISQKKWEGIKTGIQSGEILVRPDPVTVGVSLRSDQMLVYDSELDDIDYTDGEDLPEARDYMPIRFGRYGRVGIAGGILYALFVISVSIVLACVGWMFAADVLALGKEPDTAVVFIGEYEPGEGDPVYSLVNDEEREIKVDIDQVCAELKGEGVIKYKWLFKLFSHISHAETKIDPGTYSVSTALDYRAIVTSLQFGSESQEITKVTFPEGFSMAQIFALLEENHICREKELYEAAANYDFGYDFLDELELGDPNRLEGYLFPDTYEFYQGEDATVAISRFLRNFDKRFDEDMRAQAEKMGYSIHEIVTIASLIEKESAGAEESPTIASVIYNRLNDGWKLQLDSTVNYIKGTSTFDLTYEDLEIDDPYNTYLYEGLPPGPICNPGLASIQAALEPEHTNYWYWYAADGESHFFTNEDDFYAFAEAHPY